MAKTQLGNPATLKYQESALLQMRNSEESFSCEKVSEDIALLLGLPESWLYASTMVTWEVAGAQAPSEQGAAGFPASSSQAA